MKINKRILIYIILSLCLLGCIVIIINFMKRQETDKNDLINLEDIVMDINIATDVNYKVLDNDEMSLNTSITFTENTDFIFVKDENSDDNYFMIARNLSVDEIDEVKDFVEFRKDMGEEIIFKTYDNYTYMIYSKKYNSTISGIIRSYIS